MRQKFIKPPAWDILKLPDIRTWWNFQTGVTVDDGKIVSCKDGKQSIGLLNDFEGSPSNSLLAFNGHPSALFTLQSLGINGATTDIARNANVVTCYISHRDVIHVNDTYSGLLFMFDGGTGYPRFSITQDRANSQYIISGVREDDDYIIDFEDMQYGYRITNSVTFDEACHLLAITIDYYNRKVYCSIDNVGIGFDVNNNMLWYTNPEASIPTSDTPTANLLIGQSVNHLGDTSAYKGFISDVIIAHHMQSPSRINKVMKDLEKKYSIAYGS